MINCESFKAVISKEIVATFFSKLMLSYSFSINRLYNILHFVEFDIDPNNNKEDAIYDRKYQVERSYRRINNITIRFTYDQQASPKAIFKPKSYDGIMHKELILHYNRLSKKLRRPAVKQITNDLLERAQVDTPFECCRYDDWWVEKGYCIPLSSIDRDALTLPEILLYTSLYMSTRTRSIRTLNRTLNKNSDYARAVRWHDSFTSEFQSRKLFEAIVYEIFDMIFEETVGYYIKANETSIQNFWLNEKYRGRKDRKRVIEKLKDITGDDGVSRIYLEEQLEKHSERINDFFSSFESVNIAEMLLEDIIPRAELLALEKLQKPTKTDWIIAKNEYKKLSVLYCGDSKRVSTEAYDKVCAKYEELQYLDVAAWLADIVVAVVNEGYAIVEKIVDHLPESIAWK